MSRGKNTGGKEELSKQQQNKKWKKREKENENGREEPRRKRRNVRAERHERENEIGKGGNYFHLGTVIPFESIDAEIMRWNTEWNLVASTTTVAIKRKRVWKLDGIKTPAMFSDQICWNASSELFSLFLFSFQIKQKPRLRAGWWW